MKNTARYVLILIFILIILISGINSVGAENKDKNNYFYSPFTGGTLNDLSLQKAVMAVIENSNKARPQAGLDQASIVYEYLVEGGITRFLALYWEDIPNKIGPIRSARPYLIKTALSYNALMLHAGASPTGFAMFEEIKVNHLDQIYNGNYYWRGSNKKIPHNLYTGYFKISDYLKNLTGQEYEPRFNFKEISFINAEQLDAKKIKIDYWGKYNVCYEYNIEKNNYKRYIYDFEQPHFSIDKKQIEVDNIIIKFSNTEIQDKEGRLKIDVDGTGKALIFRDGTVIKGSWSKKDTGWTKFYNEDNELIEVNPGKTWIQVVPRSTIVSY